MRPLQTTLVLLLLTLLAACDRPDPLSTVAAPPAQTSQAVPSAPPVADSTVTPSAPPTADGMVTPSAGEDENWSGQMIFEKEGVDTVVLADDSIYWTSYSNQSQLFRRLIDGGEPEVVVSSSYQDEGARVDISLPLISGDWLLYMDGTDLNDTTWQVRAKNRVSGAEQVLFDSEGRAISQLGPWYDIEGDWVVWSNVLLDENGECNPAILGLINLRTGEKQELDRACSKDNYAWFFPAISNNIVVVERDFPDSKGLASNIYLFDLTDGTRRQLTTTGTASEPDISYPWVVWKVGRRYEYGWPAAYSLEADQLVEVSVPLATAEGAPKVADGRWLYWGMPGVAEEIFVYDLDQSRLHATYLRGEDTTFRAVHIRDGMIAWSKSAPASQGAANSMVEWQPLPQEVQPTVIVREPTATTLPTTTLTGTVTSIDLPYHTIDLADTQGNMTVIYVLPPPDTVIYFADDAPALFENVAIGQSIEVTGILSSDGTRLDAQRIVLP